MYPFLYFYFYFAIYLNDLEQTFVENNVNDLENIRNICSENLDIFVKLFLFLYADDTIILSETEADVYYALSILKKYCHQWKLKVNLHKTIVIIFCKRKSKNQLIFKLCGENLQTEHSYSYLSIIFK